MFRKKYMIIVGCIILMITAIILIDASVDKGETFVSLDVLSETETPSILSEKGMFDGLGADYVYDTLSSNNRSLSDYYSNRAYPGAPPTIPHPLLSEKGIGGKACLQCHKSGGYVEQFGAFAPVTPHPDFLNCRQCHAAKKTRALFVATNWEKPAHPPVDNKALITSPPVMPHSLQMRENCLACHAGPAAAKGIRVLHKERINCRQCHVPAKDLSILPDIRKNNTNNN